MIHVLAIITAKPGLRARVLEAFAANRPAVSVPARVIAPMATIALPPVINASRRSGASMVMCRLPFRFGGL